MPGFLWTIYEVSLCDFFYFFLRGFFEVFFVTRLGGVECFGVGAIFIGARAIFFEIQRIFLSSWMFLIMQWYTWLICQP